VHIRFSNKRWWLYQFAFFAAFYIALYFSLQYLKQKLCARRNSMGRCICSSTAFTGMWLMTKRKWKAGIGGLQPILLPFRCIFVKQYVI